MKSKSSTVPTAKSPAASASLTVTLEMVAEAAGVSPSTVSRILNGTAVVSAEKKQAVDEAIARLGFVPNPIARGLAGGRIPVPADEQRAVAGGVERVLDAAQ